MFEPNQDNANFAQIRVIGVGGAGCNAVNNMIAAGLTGVEFVVANTDAQALAASSAEHRLQLGVNLTEGLGAGSKPEIGEAAAEEAEQERLREERRAKKRTAAEAQAQLPAQDQQRSQQAAREARPVRTEQATSAPRPNKQAAEKPQKKKANVHDDTGFLDD